MHTHTHSHTHRYTDIYIYIYIYILAEKEKYTIFRVLRSEKTEQLICNNTIIQYFPNIFAKYSVTRKAFWN